MKKQTQGNMLTATLIVLILALGIWVMVLTQPLGFSQPYNETSLVNVTVNITNSAPLVSNVVLSTPIDLIAYDTQVVTCNATIFDFDNQTIIVNATLYIEGITMPSSPDNGNNHYTNTSCSRMSPQDRRMNYTCVFNVQYYANNNTNWRCNVTAIDPYQAFTSNISNYATVNPLVAIKIPLLLDYGDVSVNQISNDTIANITNAGNRHANISVEGYGAVPGDGLAFVCDFGTIAQQYERYNIAANSTFSGMTQITDLTTMIPNYYVPQRTHPLYDSVNYTYWRVMIPIGAGGVCNGKLLFTATDRGN
jgi:hypothetical protein